MKKKISALLLLALLAGCQVSYGTVPTVTPVFTHTPESVNTPTPYSYLPGKILVKTGSVNDDLVNLREYPGGRVLITLEYGDDVIIGRTVEMSNLPCKEWLEVTYYNLNQHEMILGWMCKRYIEEK